MKKSIIILSVLLVCQIARADTIILKDGRVIEGKVTQVRNSYVRIQADYNQPFREFLVENIANIIPSSADYETQLAIQSIHQRSLDEAQSLRVQEEVQKRADTLIEQAIQNSETLSLEGVSEETKAVVRQKVSALIGEAVKENELQSLADAPEEIKTAVQEKASTLIGEAVKSVEVQPLENTPKEVRDLAQQKAGGLIEQAVKTVEVSPFQKAPEGARLAAREAAAILIKQAFQDESVQRSSAWASLEAPEISTRADVPEEDKSLLSLIQYVIKDPIAGGLLALLFALLVVKIVRDRKMARAIQAEEAFEPVIEDAPVMAAKTAAIKPIPVNDVKEPQLLRTETAAEAGTKDPAGVNKVDWAEKRSHPRVRWDIPVNLYLDNVKPVTAVIKNLSLSGAYAVCNDYLLFKLGDRLRFNLNLSDKDPNLAINSSAEVVRIKQTRGLGLKFINLEGSSLNYLKQVIA